ncbi:hypothetical protein MNEG_6043, partial [Monoraphidium neglectum]
MSVQQRHKRKARRPSEEVPDSDGPFYSAEGEDDVLVHEEVDSEEDARKAAKRASGKRQR